METIILVLGFIVVGALIGQAIVERINDIRGERKKVSVERRNVEWKALMEKARLDHIMGLNTRRDLLSKEVIDRFERLSK